MSLIKRIKRVASRMKPRGTVHLFFYDEHGQMLDYQTKKNLVVNTGKAKMCHLLAGTAANNFPARIGAGTNGTATSLTDTALTGSASVVLGSPTVGSTGIQWPFTFTTADANGITIQEFGLLTGDGTLFSRIVWAPISKTAGMSIVGSWEIDF